MQRSLMAFAIVILLTAPPRTTAADPPKFERIVIDNDFPGAYQVEVADVNGDKKPDIIAVGGGTCAWYENPTWKKRIVTTPKQTPGIISSATADLDGDGKAEIAIAYEFEMNAPKKGKLLLAISGKTSDDDWSIREIATLGSIHRIRWGDWDGDGRPDLIEAPIFGREAKPPAYDQKDSDAVASVFFPGPHPKLGLWRFEPIGTHPILHAIEVRDLDGDGKTEVLTAGNDGVSVMSPPDDPKARGIAGSPSATRLFAGTAGMSPKRGVSEVHLGTLSGKRGFIATIEPWHGTKVVVHPRFQGDKELSAPEAILDDTLDDGHALWVADIDGDGSDEVFAGHRGKDHRVSMYRFDGKTWIKTVLDREIAAQDMRGGDLDGDGKPDVVAVGGSTHNVVWYRFK